MIASMYDPQTHTITGPHGTRVLTPHVHRLMECLLAYPNGCQVEQLIDAMWPGSTKPATAATALRVHIGRLRERLAETGVHVSLDNVQPGASLYMLRAKP